VGVFSLCICPTRRVDRVKLIRYRRRADSIPRESRFRITARNRRICRTSINAFRSREMPGFHHLSPVFLPWLGVRRRWDARRGLRPHAMSLVPCLYNRCEIAIIGAKSPAVDSASPPSIRCKRGALVGTNRLLQRPQQRSESQLELFENTEWKQWFAEKLRSQARVICATPFGKGAGFGCSKWFLCCVCRSPR
jgi:hypothetical protein